MKKPQKRAIDTRNKILDVAREMVLEVGYEGLRTEEIVASAGVAKGTLFAHFGDKDQLLFILICEEFDGTVATLVRLMNEQSISQADFIKSLYPMMHLLSRERVIFELFHYFSGVPMDGFDFDTGDDCSELQELLNMLVARLQEGGEARADTSASNLAEGCIAFVVQAASYRLSGQYKTAGEAEAAFEEKLKLWLR
ncbi:TetR/AcrR family transcriptional regulator [Sneathiella glossodoripedis]|uniref:TetR/AcrR family transcriptional regulator n=1 Tax=Sneathiella glossodoripedis TaxID=418853 RepID=UPI0011DD4D21|nr:TetR/AcrR family transcriptional regulator [Sneathiella glossodoripedis]